MSASIPFTWLGHSTLQFQTAGGVLVVDPWIATNPSCPSSHHGLVPDAVLLTHGHDDHVGDLLSLHAQIGGPIVGIYDLTQWLERRGIAGDKLIGMNKGGRLRLDAFGVEAIMTDARHSSSTVFEGQFITLGEAAGFVLRFDGGPTVYCAGDTCVFGDMALIKRLYQPDIAILPIGDHFTMDPQAAAVACELLGVSQVVPIHWGTFGALTGRPADLSAALAGLGLSTRVVSPDPGQTIELSR